MLVRSLYKKGLRKINKMKTKKAPARKSKALVPAGSRTSKKRTKKETAKAIAQNLARSGARRAKSAKLKARRVGKRAASATRESARKVAGSKAVRGAKWAVSPTSRRRLSRKARVAGGRARAGATKALGRGRDYIKQHKKTSAAVATTIGAGGGAGFFMARKTKGGR